MNIGTLETIGYSEPNASPRIEAFMAQLGARLVDIRLDPWCRWDVQWCKQALHHKYGKAYIHLRTFGNVNHSSKQLPIQLLDPNKHLAATVRALQRGLSLLLLCACKDYEQCHRKTVYELVTTELQRAENLMARPEPALLNRMEYDREWNAMKGLLSNGHLVRVATETFVEALSFMPASYLDVPEHWVDSVDGKTVWLSFEQGG